MYSELAPVLALVCLAQGLVTLRRAGRCGRAGSWLRFTALTAVCLLIGANVECYRAVLGACYKMENHVYGWPHPWSDLSFAAFALGVKPWDQSGLLTQPILVALAAAGLCFGLGLLRLFTSRRALPLGLALLVLAGLVAYFRFGSLDPWTGQVGHSWNLFKLCKWSYPFLLVIQGAGLELLLRRVQFRRVAVGLLCAAVAVLSLPFEVRFLEPALGKVQKDFASSKPLTAIRRFRAAVDRWGKKGVYYVHSGTDFLPGAFVSYLFYPHRFVNEWRSPYFQDKPAVPANSWSVEDTLFFVWKDLPFDKPLARLPCRISVIDPRHDVVIDINNPLGLEQNARGEHYFWLGGAEPVALDVWSLTGGPAELVFLAEPGPSLPETPKRRLRVISPDGTAREMTVSGRSQTVVKVALLPRESRIRLQCLDRPTVSPVADRDLRPCLVMISCVHIRRQDDNETADARRCTQIIKQE
jgi:hypothetical protein